MSGSGEVDLLTLKAQLDELRSAVAELAVVQAEALNAIGHKLQPTRGEVLAAELRGEKGVVEASRRALDAARRSLDVAQRLISP